MAHDLSADASSVPVAERIERLRARFPRVAVSHEWLTIPGGSEKVVLQFLEIFPEAEIFTAVYDPAPWPREMTDRPVHSSFLNRIPRAGKIYPRLLPLMNAAFESFDLSGFDLVISSNHSCAKNVLTEPSTLHVCFCHTPMRYAWEPRFLTDEAVGPVERLLVPPLLSRLRRQDFIASARVDHYLANSTHVAARIRKYYRRDATVVFAPAEIGRSLDVPRVDGDHYLFLGRLVPYKRADLAVAACTRLGRPLKVVGGGRAAKSVQNAAGPTVEFLGELPDAELAQVMSGARALLYPGEEDLGLVPAEAQAAGMPVIAYGVGGARDTVIDGETGLLFAEQTVEGLCDAMLASEARTFDELAIRENARRFTPERFRERIVDVLDGLEPVQPRA